jgi:hypothetical protein
MLLALTLQRGELLPFFLRLDYDYEHEHEREFVIRRPRRCGVKAGAGLARLCLAHSPADQTRQTPGLGSDEAWLPTRIRSLVAVGYT